MKVSVNKVTEHEDMQKCFDIRHEVFVKGQNVPLDEELDGKDGTSDHYLLLVDDIPAGVARVRFVDYYAKVERVAILPEYQGQGLGKSIMDAIISDLKKESAVMTVKLSSQVHAIPFYEKLGFEECSEEYMDANIPHKDMSLNF